MNQLYRVLDHETGKYLGNLTFGEDYGDLVEADDAVVQAAVDLGYSRPINGWAIVSLANGAYPAIDVCRPDEDVDLFWDEAKHPRHPAGSPQGGEFAPKGGPAAPPGSYSSPRPSTLSASVSQEPRLGAREAKVMATPLFERSGALTLTAPKANSEGVEYFAQNLVMAIGGVESVELRTGGKVAKTMPEAEAMIQKNWYETLAGFDAEGRMRFAQTGNADGVDVSEDAQGIIQAWGENGDPLMFTHNHPGAMLPGVGTLTVSPGDLWVTLDAHAAGIRAISPEGGVFEVRYGPPSQRPTPPVIVGEKLTLGKWASVLWGEARRQAAFELQVVGYPSREHVEKVRYRYPGRAIKHFRDIAPPELLQYIQFKYKRPPKGK